jgi:serine protease Do
MTLGAFPSTKKLASLRKDEPADQSEQMEKLGLSLAPAATIPGAGKDGVVITEVNTDSDAADKGLKPGDIILQVAGVDVATPADIATGLAKATESATGDKDKVKVLMQVKTGDQTRFVALSQKKE